MSDVAWGVMLLTGALWVVGPVWRWCNIRRLGKLVARLRRAARQASRAVKTAGINPAPVDSEQRAPRESLWRSNRWMVG